jgi:hypothetical protein
MNLSESYKKRLQELANIMSEKEITYPGTYSILTQNQIDKHKNSSLPLSIKLHGHHFLYDNEEELYYMQKNYPKGGMYQGSIIVNTSINDADFGQH